MTSISSVDPLYLHFNVEEHALKLDTFVETARRAQKIVRELNRAFFNDDLKFEIIVRPPIAGSFLARLDVRIFGGIAVIFTFLNTDIGSAFIEGLTGETPEYYARKLGEGTRDTLEDAQKWMKDQEQSQNAPSGPACAVGTAITVAMTKGILQLEKDKLDKLGIKYGDLVEAIEARNEFYEACLADNKVKGIGFTPDDDFPIPRSSFPERAVKTRRKEEDEDELPWTVSTETITVTSPNWDKEDQSARQWKGKDSTLKTCYFVVEDDNFWQSVKNRELEVGTLDKMQVQWAYQSINNRAKNHRVLRVLKLNGQKVTKHMSSQEMKTTLKSYKDAVTQSDQGLLFE